MPSKQLDTALDPAPIDVMWLRAQRAFGQGNWDDAVIHLTALTTVRPDAAEAAAMLETARQRQRGGTPPPREVNDEPPQLVLPPIRRPLIVALVAAIVVVAAILGTLHLGSGPSSRTVAVGTTVAPAEPAAPPTGAAPTSTEAATTTSSLVVTAAPAPLVSHRATIVVDGDPGEWARPLRKIDDVVEGGTPTLTAEFAMAWNLERVYAVVVVDDDLADGEDRVTLLFDQNLTGDRTNPSPDEDDFQVVLHPWSSPGAGVSPRVGVGAGDGYEAVSADGVTAVKTTFTGEVGATGYVIETAIPWTVLGLGQPDNVMGFGLTVVDGEGWTIADLAGTDEADPTTWDRLEFRAKVPDVHGLPVEKGIARLEKAGLVVSGTESVCGTDEGTVQRVVLDDGAPTVTSVVDAEGAIAQTLIATTPIIIEVANGSDC